MFCSIFTIGLMLGLVFAHGCLGGDSETTKESRVNICNDLWHWIPCKRCIKMFFQKMISSITLTSQMPSCEDKGFGTVHVLSSSTATDAIAAVGYCLFAWNEETVCYALGFVVQGGWDLVGRGLRVNMSNCMIRVRKMQGTFFVLHNKFRAGPKVNSLL